jgi:outer membrane protein assembly factor BamB
MKMAFGIVVVAVLAVNLSAGEALGSPNFKPTPEQPVGWRGDGTGCYPKATPPIEWGRISKTLKELKAQAQKPKGDAPSGQSVADGVIRDWLILGPVPEPEGGKLATDFIPNEAQMRPDENEKSGAFTWKAIKAESSCLDFNTILGAHPKSAVYAHSYIYSKAACSIVLGGTFHNGVRVWLNGKDVWTGEKAWCVGTVLSLTPGWNSLLFKLIPDAAPDGPPKNQWYFSPQLYGRAPYDYETKNIAWMCPMPGTSNASPIVVGDKVFTTAETYDLVCVNKADGKILWVNSANYFDTLTDEDMKANPALKEGVPWADRIKQINKAYSSATPPDWKAVEEKRGLEKKLYDLLQTVDKKKYKLLEGQDVGYAGMAPVSDGKFVYAWYATGITVCYDLNGNRKWIHLDNDGAIREHGVATSPALVGGKLIVHMNETLGLDAATGAVAWRLPRYFYQGSLTGFTLGNVPLFLEPNGGVHQASDGKALHTVKSDAAIPTPVLKDGVVYFGVDSLKLPATAAEPFTMAPFKPAAKVSLLDFPHFYFICGTASPLVHDGLLYSVDIDGVLTVVDIAASQVLYQKLLDVNVVNHANMKAARGLGASPALAGKYIYIFGNQGTAVVLEAGRVFKQVGKNRIEDSVGQGQWWEHQETSISNPVFEGDRMYYRGEENLYCIGAK